MSIPMEFAETKDELVRSLRRDATDYLNMSKMKTPLISTVGERYALMAKIVNNIVDRIDAAWNLELSKKKKGGAR